MMLIWMGPGKIRRVGKGGFQVETAKIGKNLP